MMKTHTYIGLLLLLLLTTGCGLAPAEPAQPITATEPSESMPAGSAEPYFGEPMPGASPVRFAIHIFTHEFHSPPIFSPDGREVFWSEMEQSNGLLHMRIENGEWTEPARAPFDQRGAGDSAFISADGNTLLFIDGDTIYQVERSQGEWGSPQALPAAINSHGAHWQSSMADNGNLYFGSEGDIYVAEYVDGRYLAARNLGAPVNTAGDREGSPFIARDESYILFDRSVNQDYADLYIAFRNVDGSWGEPVAMNALNSSAHDLYASVSPDGRYIMFLSGRYGRGLEAFWVDAGIIEELRSAQE